MLYDFASSKPQLFGPNTVTTCRPLGLRGKRGRLSSPITLRGPVPPAAATRKSRVRQTKANAWEPSNTMVDPETTYTGICYLRSQVKTANVTDGLSNTYLIGEKNINADNYFTGLDDGDDQSMYTGFNDDNHRSTYYDAVAGQSWTPMQDVAGIEFPSSFGRRMPDRSTCRCAMDPFAQSATALIRRRTGGWGIGQTDCRSTQANSKLLFAANFDTGVAWSARGELTHEGGDR